jgi:hypothetical protein
MDGVSSEETWQQYVCGDEAAAQREAEKQTAEDPEGAEWIYLRDNEERWVARRIPPGWTPPKPKPNTWKQAIIEQVFNPAGWGGF